MEIQIGIREGDLMLTAAGQPVTTAQALQRLMLADAIGRQLPITVVRNGALVDLIATPVELVIDERYPNLVKVRSLFFPEQVQMTCTVSGEANPSWQQVLRSLNAKGGERKRLTILFADIRNSTELIDGLGDPELGIKRLQPIESQVIDGDHLAALEKLLGEALDLDGCSHQPSPSLCSLE